MRDALRRSRSRLRVAVVGIDPRITKRILRTAPGTDVLRTRIAGIGDWRARGLDVVVVGADVEELDALLDQPDPPPTVVVGDAGDLSHGPRLAVVHRDPDSPTLQLAMDTVRGVPRLRRVARSLRVEQDNPDLVTWVAFGVRTLVGLFTVAWFALNLDVVGVLPVTAVAAWLVVRALWLELNPAAVWFDIAAATMVTVVSMIAFGPAALVTAALPLVAWFQAGWVRGFLRALAGLLVLVGLAWGWSAAFRTAVPFSDGDLAAPVIFALLGAALGAMAARLFDPGNASRRAQLEEFRFSLYDLAEQQAAVGTSLDAGTVANLILANLVERTEPEAAMVLTRDGVGPMTVGAVHNVRGPAPPMIQWWDGNPPAGTGTQRRAPAVEDRVQMVLHELRPVLPGGRTLAAPCLVDGEVLGVVVVVNPHEDATQGTVTEIADDAALVLDSVRLFNRLRDRAVDHERSRIGRNLHDGVMQTLSHVGLQLDLAVRDHDVVADAASLRELRGHVTTVLEELRDVVHDLRSAPLDRGLSAALEHMAATFSRAGGPAIRVEAGPVPDLPPDTERHLVLIAQESVSNAVQHAHATTVTVRVHAIPDWLVLQIADDGHGFSESERQDARRGIGLTSLRQRADAIGARIDIDSGPGAMVTVLCPAAERRLVEASPNVAVEQERA